MFGKITKEVQKKFEVECNGIALENIPMICGYCGRVCRQMDKEEGTNRMICIDCPLAEFAEKLQKKETA